MIEINLLEKKKSFKAPVVLGVDVGKLPWIPIIISLVLAEYPLEFLKEEFQKEQEAKNQEVALVRNQLNKLKADLRKNQGVKDQLSAFNRQIEKLKERSEQVDKIIKQRTNPRYLLEKIARSTPDDLWFDQLLINDKDEITITGGSYSYTSIGDFIIDANNSPYFGKTLVLKESKTEESQENGVPTRRQETFVISGNISVYDPFMEGR